MKTETAGTAEVCRKKQNLECVQNFRLTGKQQKYLETAAETYGITESAYLRKLLEKDMGAGDPGLSLEERKLRKQLIFEINRIGNNINQIVHNHNSQFYSFQDKKKLKELMERVQELFMEYLQSQEKR